MDDANATHPLREGLAKASVFEGTSSVDARAHHLSAAFDRAALEIDGGADVDEVLKAMRWLLVQTVGPDVPA